MYIHRIVIDANHINARGGIPEMNFLEDLHDRGLVEILQTSTLAADFRQNKGYPIGQEKARRYDVIGGNVMMPSPNGKYPYCSPGTGGRESRFMEIHQIVFPKPTSDKMHDRNIRDVLHIDQANQHNADFFITNDIPIWNAYPALAAKGIDTRLCSAEDCVAEVTAYFIRHYGTADPLELTQLLNGEGPIFLGSNSCGGIAFTDVENGEELLAFQLTDAGASIRTVIRGHDGSRLMTIVPGQPVVFDVPWPSLRMEFGPAPFLVGDKHCHSFTVTANGAPILEGRVLRSGRLLMHHISLYNKSGKLAIHVTRDALELVGVIFSEVK